MNFQDVNWGKDEAKNDEGLRDYFVEFRDFGKIRTGDKRYVIGRKGTGKTAIIERIKIENKEKENAYHISLSLKDFPLQDLISLKDKSYREKAQFVPIWSFLLYIELAKMICKDNKVADSIEKDNLKNFLKLNNLDNEVGFISTIEELKSNQAKLKLDAKWIGTEQSDSTQVNQTSLLHFNKVVKKLEDCITKIRSQSEYWILIDELDEGYKHGDSSLKLILLALLRAVENSALDMKESQVVYRPLLVMRSDIFDSLADNDLNKLDEFTIRLNWSSDNTESDYALKSIVNARIRKSISTASDPWSSIVYDQDFDLPDSVNTIWGYMINRTYERPRDILKFLKICSDSCKEGKLKFKSVQSAENKYSEWLYKEIRDEIHSYLDCWNHTFSCITKVGYGKFEKTQLVEKINSDKMIAGWMRSNKKSADDILQLLFDFGVIGTLTDDGRWTFKYKDHDLSYDEEIKTIIVHYGLAKKLRLNGLNK